jgi:serine protease
LLKHILMRSADDQRFARAICTTCATTVLLILSALASPVAVQATGLVGASAGAYAQGEVLVRYASTAPDAARARIASAAGGGGGQQALDPYTRLIRLKHGVSVSVALDRLRSKPGVVWAVPDYRARSATVTPDDPGAVGEAPGNWQLLQWNFVGPFGVDALQAWSNLAAAGAPGGSGVVVAVLDTGVAYANRGRFLRSPDFSAQTFVKGYDFVSHTPYANDLNGHGTFVAGTIAETTNNGYGLTGLAYGARIMPVRVLDSAGEGDASVIAEGIRFAVNHDARAINLSLEFPTYLTAADVPELIDALRYAHHRNVVVVAAAGNQRAATVPYPARAPGVIAVGATTEHGCLASYSDYGRRVTLVAPGGGTDAYLPDDPDCHPELASGRNIYQVTFAGTSPRLFGLPSNYEGTSMAAPHVTATAAMVIASGVLGRRPTPEALTALLKRTARKLGGPQDRYMYGAGLLDAGAATAPAGP